jgi:hypothetical protein
MAKMFVLMPPLHIDILDRAPTSGWDELENVGYMSRQECLYPDAALS